jgi:hypothetical protein
VADKTNHHQEDCQIGRCSVNEPSSPSRARIGNGLAQHRHAFVRFTTRLDEMADSMGFRGPIARGAWATGCIAEPSR